MKNTLRDFFVSLREKRRLEGIYPPGLDADRRKNLVHFLHLGKNAGTAIKALIRKINQEAKTTLIAAHGHRVKLSDLPKDAAYFFSIRDPITRFYSGFYSKKRKGAPRLYVEWKPGEEKAFSRFSEANDLAENLFAEGEIGVHAFSAMQTIGHVRQPQHSWFADIETMLVEHPPICILRQEHLQNDVYWLGRALGITTDLTLETDTVKAHKNDYSATPKLSAKAIENLKLWYAADLQFYKLADAWARTKQS